MNQSRRYYRRSRIPDVKFCQLLRYFAEDRSATEVAQLTGLTRKSVTTIFLKIRQRIAEHCERNSPLSSELSSNESLSCSRCICGRCRSSLSRNTPLFALLNRRNKIFTMPVPDCRKPIIRALIRGRIAAREVPTDGWHGYDALVDAEYSKPLILEHPEKGSWYREASEAIDAQQFWSFTQRRFEKFNGVSRRTFYLHLKESEWRFNLADSEPLEELLKLIETNPL